MRRSRRSALQALRIAAGIAAGVAATAVAQTRIPAVGATIPATQRREELEACIPDGDPLQALLQRNRIFSKAWQRSSQASDPQERMRIKRAIFNASCRIAPQTLAQAQRPWAALFCCADSRVAPEWMFGLGSGALFQVRVAGNTTFNDGIASLGYAVAVLQRPLILVIGHSGCGALKAAMGREPLTPLLEELVQVIHQSLVAGDDLSQAIRGNARYAAKQLTQRSRTLADAQAAGKVSLATASIDLQTGLVSTI